jgi:hypothetical protein
MSAFILLGIIALFAFLIFALLWVREVYRELEEELRTLRNSKHSRGDGFDDR